MTSVWTWIDDLYLVKTIIPLFTYLFAFYRSKKLCVKFKKKHTQNILILHNKIKLEKLALLRFKIHVLYFFNRHFFFTLIIVLSFDYAWKTNIKFERDPNFTPLLRTPCLTLTNSSQQSKMQSVVKWSRRMGVEDRNIFKWRHLCQLLFYPRKYEYWYSQI